MSETSTMEKTASSPKSIRLVSVNKVTLSGRLTGEPVIQTTGKGNKVATFQIAVNRRYKDKAGEWQEDVSFFTVTAWNALADRCEKTAHKGSPVFVEGRLRSESWEVEGGMKRHAVKVEAFQIQFLERSKSEKVSGEIPFGE